MDESINKDLGQKARDLALPITVAHDLDPEIQEELYGHIEDKLLAYKGGEERISDEDAFILVQEHFGDAKVLRGLLQEVHAGAVRVSLLRRILALVIVTAALQAMITLLRSITIAVLVVRGVLDRNIDNVLLTTSMAFAMFVVLFQLLHRWRRSELSGETPWYARWTMPQMLKGLAIAVVMTWVVPTVSLSLGADSRAPRDVLNVVTELMVLSVFMSSCLIWLWWTDAAARGLANNLALGWLWALFMILTSVYPAKTFIALGDYAIPSGSSTFAHSQLGEVPVTAFLAYGGRWESMSNIIADMKDGVLVALVASIVAACWHMYQRWQQSHANASIAQV